ncbi:acetate/propionate family kinase [Perlucidibaca piscinae]|uniref:acetate/propionate family kinase n=1 Tax=Perlucidibaca piscinae TaxID=392589 RepID=UPI0003B69D08|nr:acetate kinase [Perlucidibaca piscinae]
MTRTRQILVINGGSSSIKFALIRDDQPEAVLTGLAERLGTAEARLRWTGNGSTAEQAIAGADHARALATLLPLVEAAAAGGLTGIGHRVVHGGERFSGACRLTPETLAAIRATSPLAPLHNPANLLGIEAAMAVFPSLPHVAVFDTAFHQTLPARAYRYALPEFLYQEHGVRRYGFHGTSHRYVSQQAIARSGLAEAGSGWLCAHLGNGASTCAIADGRSVDTSMGLTPLEGLVMGTRSGDVDPNLHGHLARTLGWSLPEIDRLLNHESGLLGLSGGLSNDMRTLEQARADGHAGATLAVEVFCYRLAKSLAAMSCALPRLDGLIFTGGIGENSALVRERTVAQLHLLGLRLDAAANARCIRGEQGRIDNGSPSPQIWVIATNEERQIALDTLAVLAATP